MKPLTQFDSDSKAENVQVRDEVLDFLQGPDVDAGLQRSYELLTQFIGHPSDRPMIAQLHAPGKSRIDSMIDDCSDMVTRAMNAEPTVYEESMARRLGVSVEHLRNEQSAASRVEYMTETGETHGRVLIRRLTELGCM